MSFLTKLGCIVLGLFLAKAMTYAEWSSSIEPFLAKNFTGIKTAMEILIGFYLLIKIKDTITNTTASITNPVAIYQNLTYHENITKHKNSL